MRIIVDAHIPFVVEAVQRNWPQTEVLALEPEEIGSSSVRDADVLIIRTRTKVNEALLAGSSVRLVCTATIGYDHIDRSYCETHSVRWISCPGCNAQAVCDYIEEAIEETMDNSQCTMHNSQFTMHNSQLSIGVVGVGHVGSLVAQMAERKGFKVLLNDPPKGIGVSLDEIARQCDIITFHTPLDNTTYHLCDAAFLAQCKPGALIINAARGGVVDEEALLQSGHPFILDTWEKEPEINAAVLEKSLLASMHIAGYSVQGKRNASQMCLDAVSELFGLPKIDISRYLYSASGTKKGDSEPGWLLRISHELKNHPTDFESLRKVYPLRGE